MKRSKNLKMKISSNNDHQCDHEELKMKLFTLAIAQCFFQSTIRGSSIQVLIRLTLNEAKNCGENNHSESEHSL